MARGFDGANSIVTFAIPDLSGDKTIAAWVKPSSAGEGNAGIVFRGEIGTGTGYVLQIAGSTLTLRCDTNFDVTNSSTITTTTIPTGAWSLVVATYTASDKKWRIYVGSLSAPVAEAAYSSQVAGSATPAAGVTSGMWGNGSNLAATFAGSIARGVLDARVWTLDDMERFRTGRMPAQSPAATVAVLHPLTSPTVGQAEDLSGNGRNGTVSTCTVDEEPPVVLVYA